MQSLPITLHSRVMTGSAKYFEIIVQKHNRAAPPLPLRRQSCRGKSLGNLELKPCAWPPQRKGPLIVLGWQTRLEWGQCLLQEALGCCYIQKYKKHFSAAHTSDSAQKM
ncbi:hypothetical protein CEXT_76381 [Caerostris extrusa]|uniref:Uncharacterized protein n=1 Tax=Caerostris extrusa TaxID=172846 RepID=A0AAV4QH33_CAEEX|nr:hypothetical protein CEXT_76381 [Caerostris extrusa]